MSSDLNESKVCFPPASPEPLPNNNEDAFLEKRVFGVATFAGPVVFTQADLLAQSGGSQLTWFSLQQTVGKDIAPATLTAGGGSVDAATDLQYDVGHDDYELGPWEVDVPATSTVIATWLASK